MSKALVLSGGGPVGIAWQTGIAAGLAKSRLDLSTADFIVGTSAGSAVGAQIALGRDLAAVLDRYRSHYHQPESGSAPRNHTASTTTVPTTTLLAPGAGGPMQDLHAHMARAESTGCTPEQARSAIGRFALDAGTGPEETFINRFRHLRGQTWPERFACTAVDADTGEFVVWNAENTADLDRAVASSCAVPGVFPPITINGRRYIDGGLRSGSSLDLAAGHELVLLVSLRDPIPASADTSHLEPAQQRLRDERLVIEDAGGLIVTITPDLDAAAAIGPNPHDVSVSPAAAVAGFRQGVVEAQRLHPRWT